MDRDSAPIDSLSGSDGCHAGDDAPAIMEELREVLGRPKFRLRIRTLQTSVSEVMESLLSIVEVVQDSPIEPVIKRDPDDDKILACAIAAQADWIVSGDDHLLCLKR
jgi:putative PIN family toxin of toxin-antitoxin system